ncbi:MAG: TetR/AcrR family transcriptional regulator [Coriobacteriia bacterium]|nr:TetR/AcrR family transcriptional regulator [Coriobacteriia bacterium]
MAGDTGPMSTAEGHAYPQPSGRQDVKEAVLDAATELLSHRPPSAVTVREIAEQAGVSHTLVHRYFGSKQELIRDVLERADSEMQPLFDGETDIQELVARVFRDSLDRRLVIGAVAQALIDGVPGEEVQRESLVTNRLVQEFEAALSAQRSKDVPMADPQLAMAVVVALIVGWTLFEDWLLHVADLKDRDMSEVRRDVEQVLARLTEHRTSSGP